MMLHLYNFLFLFRDVLSLKKRYEMASQLSPSASFLVFHTGCCIPRVPSTNVRVRRGNIRDFMRYGRHPTLWMLRAMQQQA